MLLSEHSHTLATLHPRKVNIEQQDLRDSVEPRKCVFDRTEAPAASEAGGTGDELTQTLSCEPIVLDDRDVNCVCGHQYQLRRSVRRSRKSINMRPPWLRRLLKAPLVGGAGKRTSIETPSESRETMLSIPLRAFARARILSSPLPDSGAGFGNPLPSSFTQAMHCPRTTVRLTSNE